MRMRSAPGAGPGTVSRTGDRSEALTASLVVEATDGIVEGAASSEAVFGAGEAHATVSVATADDDADATAASVTVLDDDATPAITSQTTIFVPENTTAVAVLEASDADTAATGLTWTMANDESGGPDREAFELRTAGALSFSAPPDFESPNDAGGDYMVTVRVSDGANAAEAALMVPVSDVDATAPRPVEARRDAQAAP